MRFRCITFGCWVNQYETQAIREPMETAGLSEALEGEAADVVVINSCTVTEKADRECFSRLEGDPGRVGELVSVGVAGLAPDGLRGKIFRGVTLTK